MNSALLIYELKDHRTLFGEDVATPVSGDVTLVIKLLTGLVAGIVGATFMVAGSALAVPALRGVAPMLTTGLVGGLAGLLLYFFLSGWHETLALLIILPVWQASVGFCIGHWLGLS